MAGPVKAGAPLRRAVTVWRRSIQARVVISTLLLSAVVVSLVGWVLLQQITDGLVHRKTESSVAEAPGRPRRPSAPSRPPTATTSTPAPS